MIKAVAVLNHQHRQKDAKGRVVADVQDYRTVYGLVGEIYEASVSGASAGVREVVKTVQKLYHQQFKLPISITVIAKTLGTSKMTVSRRVKVAVTEGCLENEDGRKGYIGAGERDRGGTGRRRHTGAQSIPGRGFGWSRSGSRFRASSAWGG